MLGAAIDVTELAAQNSHLDISSVTPACAAWSLCNDNAAHSDSSAKILFASQYERASVTLKRAAPHLTDTDSGQP